MPSPAALLELYLHLANASEEHRQPLQRDKFLVLAGGLALRAGFPRIAEECRLRILERNPGHLLARYPTMRDAFTRDEVRQFANHLLRVYPFEKAEYLLVKFRAAGYSDGAISPLATGAMLPAPPVAKRPNRSTPRPNSIRPRPQVRSMLPPPATIDVPLENPLIAAAAPRTRRTVSLVTCWCWVLLALGIGIAIGGIAVAYFVDPAAR